ncbi:MAG: hypothetical protein M0C28_00135 [Candidatus Moduliflexus flocculans]|nr:hypothetical protein [Candidatus Moduliflexus flocculans]
MPRGRQLHHPPGDRPENQRHLSGQRGSRVEEPGEVVFPIKVVGELFKKVPADTFIVEVQGGARPISRQARAITGSRPTRWRNSRSFRFPRQPASSIPPWATWPGSWTRARSSGSPNEEFPQYLGTALFQVGSQVVRVVSTDGRRLSLSTADISPGEATEESRILLPLKGSTS